MMSSGDGGGPAARRPGDTGRRAAEEPRVRTGRRASQGAAGSPSEGEGPGGSAACGWALLEHWHRWAGEPLTAEQHLLRALWSVAADGERLALARTFLRAFGGREER